MHEAASTRDEPSPGRSYALQAKTAIAGLRERGAFCQDRDPLVPRAQRDPREQGRSRMGKAGLQRAGRPRGRVAGVC